MDNAPPSHEGSRYPVEVIAHCVWLYLRFPLSFREVEELMLERGVMVPHGTSRRWCAKCGQSYATGVRPSAARPRPIHRPTGTPACSWVARSGVRAGRRPSPTTVPRR